MKQTLLIIALFIGLSNVNAQKMVGYITVHKAYAGGEGVFMTTIRYCNFFFFAFIPQAKPIGPAPIINKSNMI